MPAPPPSPEPSTPPPAARTAGSGPRRSALWTAAVCGALGAVLLAAVSADWPALTGPDRRLARTLHESALAHPGWTHAARILTDWVWDPLTMRAAAFLTVLVLLWRAQRGLALLVALAVLAAALLQQLLKAAVDRPRPAWRHPVDTAHYASMPSGHAMTAAVVCGLLGWLVWSRSTRPALRAAAVCAAGVSVVGVSCTRIYLGVHWLTDVVAGTLLGLAVAAFAVGCWRPKRTSETIPA